MSKITFRADDELVDRVERLDASKSEVMREALRAYLDERGDHGTSRRSSGRSPASERSLDDLLADRLDTLLAERLDAMLADRLDGREGGQDIDLTVSLEGAAGDAHRQPASDTQRSPRREAPEAGNASSDASDGAGDAPTSDDRACSQCGEALSDGHVYCPNCGEKASRRVFCDCGDEIRTDWAFCPGCGRRTPAADVLDSP